MSDTPTNHPGLPAPSSPTTAHPAVTPSTPSSTQSGTHLPPPLPAPSAEETTSIEINGAAVSLADKLGPAIVNSDGTMSRIANWPSMTEAERRNTLRVLGKRNKLRLEALRDADGQDEPDKGKD